MPRASGSYAKRDRGPSMKATRVRQAEPLGLAVAAEGGGKKNQRKPATAADDEHFEIATHVRRPSTDNVRS
jgi:hypothetical protein